MIRVSFWTAVFLILLRICIGWHFFYEGQGKVKSAYAGKAALVEKPFSSESYFREAEGPFGRLVKKWIGDLNQETIDRLTLVPVEGDKSLVKPVSRFPEALGKEWDDYYSQFVNQYKLDDAQQQAAMTKLEQTKANFVAWLDVTPEALKAWLQEEKAVKERLGYLGDSPAGKELSQAFNKKAKPYSLTVKKTAPGPNATATYDAEVTVLERVEELRQKASEVRTIYEEKLPQFGKDVAGASLRKLKTEINEIRAQLNKEIDSQTTRMKDALASVLGNRIKGYVAKIENQDELQTLKEMLKPMAEGNPLGKLWDEYATYVNDNSTKANTEAIAETLQAAKTRFDRWLLDQDEFTGQPSGWSTVTNFKMQLTAPQIKDKDGKVVRDDAQTAVAALQTEFKRHTDALKAQLGSLTDEQAKGYVFPVQDRYFGIVPKLNKPIEFIDWSTRWFLVIVGSCLIVGLFTRLMCFSASVFLLLTVLTQPSLPWLPAPPNSEGNYFIINKNVVEMVALWALMTTRSGLWLGLDAIIVAIFGRSETPTK